MGNALLVTDTLSVHDESVTVKRHERGMNYTVHTEGVRDEQRRILVYLITIK
jgi:hypothetical protein